MLLYYDKSARREEMRKALARKSSTMDLTLVEPGEDAEGLGHTWEVGIGICISALVLVRKGASGVERKLELYLLGGNCFFRPREALRGSKLEASASARLSELKPDDCSSSSGAFHRGSDLASSDTFLLAFKQRLHRVDLDMRRRVRVKWQDISPGAILEGYQRAFDLRCVSDNLQAGK
jgi:hypothetical protein